MKLTRELVVSAYRILLERDPESEAVIDDKLRALKSLGDLRREILSSAEFKARVGAIERFESTNVVIKEIAPRLRIFVDLSDAHIGVNVINGSYEPHERAFISATVKPGQVAIDVGANIGFFALVMADLVGEAGHVYAFEPLPRNATLLERSVQENQFENRMTVERSAVGQQPGNLELISAIVTNHWGGPYLRTGTASVPVNHETTLVPILRLDDYSLRRPVSFIKIDAEGAEVLALRGAARLLQEDRPTILAEVNPQQLAMVSSSTPNELISDLAQFGYRCHPLEAGGPQVPIDRYEAQAVINAAFIAR